MKTSLRIIFVCLFFAFISASPVFSATWNGGGADNLASTAGNWEGSVLPPTGDTILFNNTSSKDCTWDISQEYTVLVIDGGYNGAVAIDATGTLTLSGTYLAPAAPTGLSAVAISSSRIDLSWTDNAATEAGFRIERKIGIAGTYNQIGTAAIDANSYSDTDPSLLPGTIYYYQVKSYDIFGESAPSPEANATTFAIAPTATTNAVSNNAGTTATLNGTVNPNGAETTVSFEWGATASYGNTTSPQIIPAGTIDVAVLADITGISASTPYHFRVKAVNSIGTTYGLDESFSTPVIAPSATTNAVSNNVGKTATLNGTVNPNGADTTVSFEWGIDTSYGNTTSSQVITAGIIAVAKSANISGLTPNTPYHFRVKAVNSIGTTYGLDVSFTTPIIAPSATTNAVSNNTTGNSATLNGSINPNGAETTVSFEWGLDTSYGNTTSPQIIPSGTIDVAVLADITGLSPNTIYHYKVKAVNSIGTTYGLDASFTTPVMVPSATTNAVSNNTTGNSATLNGSINPNGAATAVYFQWGTDTSYGNTTTTQNIPAGNNNVAVTANISGLAVGTLFHYRVVAANSAGTTNGNDILFTTPSHAKPFATTNSATNKNGNSATLNATVNPNDLITSVHFEWGTTASYGHTTTPSISLPAGPDNIFVSANITGLTPGQTYHYRVVATNADGTTNGTDMSFISPPITITIVSPADGSTIYRPDTMVKGSFTTTIPGNETGVTVNGVVGMVYNNQFAVNHVPLVNGANTISVTATDTAGNTATTAVTVTAVIPYPYVKLTANTESGVSPLTVNFTASTSIPNAVTTYKIDYDGNGTDDYTGSTFTNISHAYSAPGIYYARLTVLDSASVSYTDTIAIVVLNSASLDGSLRNIWNSMKARLTNNDPVGASGYYSSASKDKYLSTFSTLSGHLPEISTNMQDIILNYMGSDTVEYRIIRNELVNGQPTDVMYYIYFMKDDDGLWKIQGF